MTSPASRGAAFVMPRTTREWSSASGVWIAAASWAAAARRRYGAARVITPDGMWSPEQILEQIAPRVHKNSSTVVRHTPVIAKTLAKDIRRYRKASRYHIGDGDAWDDVELQFVWQHHDLFHRAGEELARRRGCPLVSFVHAPQVWEARLWGVHRPGWGSALERYGERPQLLASDVVACVSDEVAHEVVRFGVAEERIVVCPTGVDPDHFGPQVSGDAARERLSIAASFTVGWVGSFRSFHGLDTLLEAFARLRVDVPDARLLLVGGGGARDDVEHLAQRLGISDATVFTGEVRYMDVPELVAAMDVAVVSAAVDDGFHYSPQKLREYMAMGTPVVAASVPDIHRFVRDRRDALLFKRGDSADLARQLRALYDDRPLRATIGAAGQKWVVANGTWDAQLERLVSSEPFRAAATRTRRSSVA
jgi:glycosyltransferase involved in cell wall biosynthesis